MNQGRKVENFHFHPTEKKWLLTTAYSLCEDYDNPKNCPINQELYVSFDLGFEWDVIATYVTQAEWFL